SPPINTGRSFNTKTLGSSILAISSSTCIGCFKRVLLFPVSDTNPSVTLHVYKFRFVFMMCSSSHIRLISDITLDSSQVEMDKKANLARSEERRVGKDGMYRSEVDC